MFMSYISVCLYLSSSLQHTFFTFPQFTWSQASHAYRQKKKTKYIFFVVTGCPPLPQGCGSWATAAASSGLRQDITLMKFMLRSFSRQTSWTSECSDLRDGHKPPYIYTCSQLAALRPWGPTPVCIFSSCLNERRYDQIINRSDIWPLIRLCNATHACVMLKH